MAQKAIKLEELPAFIEADDWSGVDRLIVPAVDGVTLVFYPGTTSGHVEGALAALSDVVSPKRAKAQKAAKKPTAKAAK